jgi:hypothetical protein
VVLPFVVGVLLIQALWVITLPPFHGSDEFDHAYRAVAVAGGEWRTTKTPDDGRGLLVTVPESLVEAARAQCESLPYTGPDNCSPVQRLGDGQVLVASGAANYNPLFYAVIGWAATPFEGASVAYALRASAALLCLAFLGAACWALTRQRSRWPVAGLMLAVSPVMVYSTSLGAPNGLEMASAVALWSALLALVTRAGEIPERPLLWLAFISATTVCTPRLLGPLFAALILGTVVLLGGKELRGVMARNRGTVWSGAALVSVSIVLAGGWVLWTGSAGAPPEAEGTTDWNVATSLVRWTLQTIAAFPFQNQPGAWIVYPVFGAPVLVLTLAAIRLGGRRERLALGASMAVALCLPLVLTVATRGGRGVIWQGRYGLPYCVGFILIAATVVGRRVLAPRLPSLPVWLAVACIGVANAACLLKVRREEMILPATLADPGWHNPPTVLIVSVSAMAAVAYGIALTAGRRVRE